MTTVFAGDPQSTCLIKDGILFPNTQGLIVCLVSIQAKQGKMEEMTPGQAATLARNEQVIDTATDNLEELEEELNSSIAETLKGKKRKNPEPTATK